MKIDKEDKYNLVSIIIPIYNTEKYIKRCLNSVLINKPNLEVICVNDGSTDNSLKILENFSKIDNRIRIISQNNMGVSCARNTGIKAATGKWLFFVDSDDIVLSEYYDAIKQLEEDIDICFFDSEWGNSKIDNKNRDIKVFQKENQAYLVSRMMQSKSITDNDECPLRSPCFKAYNREMIINNNIFFDEKVIIGEDYLFNIKAFCIANKIKYIPKNVYIVYEREGSATHSYVPNMIEEELNFLKVLKKNLIEVNLFNQLKFLYILEIKSGIMRCLRKEIFHPMNNNTILEKKKRIAKLIENPIFCEGINYKDNNLKRKFVMFLIKYKMVYLLKFVMNVDNCFAPHLWCELIKLRKK